MLELLRIPMFFLVGRCILEPCDYHCDYMVYQPFLSPDTKKACERLAANFAVSSPEYDWRCVPETELPTP